MTDQADSELLDDDTRCLGGERWEEGVTAALTRAAKQAHLIAYQTGSGVAYRRNGKFGVYAPDPEMYEDLIPPPFVEQPES